MHPGTMHRARQLLSPCFPLILRLMCDGSQGGAMTQGAIDAFIAAGRDLVPMTSEGNNGALKAWYEIAITA